MQIQNEAEEHLRVIRSLMEKATIYRAVSAPTALAGGIVAVIVASSPVQAYFEWRMGLLPSFQIRWLIALFVTLLINTGLILREARRRGDPLISPGMKAAIRALLPPFFCGGVFFSFFGTSDMPALLDIFYGLGLLATGHFAPRSIVWLGWSFLLAGLAAFVVSAQTNRADFGLSPDLTMAATFGGFHFIYAACTWPRRAPTAEPSGTP